MGKQSKRLAIGLVALILYLPFVDQAFHVDDRIYLEIAENILDKPLFPYDYPPLFEGLRTPDAASHSHLPLTAYYLALLRTLVGYDVEWVYHLGFLIFPLLAGFAFYDLSRRYIEYPLAAAILLLSAPSFLVLGHTLMPDVPLLAMWVVSLSRFLRIYDGDSSRVDKVVLVLALIGASFISVVSFGLVLLMGAYLALERKRLPADVRWRFWLVVLATPLVLWFLWYLRAYFYYDRFVLINTLLHMDQRAVLDPSLLASKILSFVLDSGGLFIFPLAVWLGFGEKVSTRIALIVFFLVFVPFYLLSLDWAWIHILLFAVFLASGVLVVWAMVLLLREKGSFDSLLLPWFFGIFAACLLIFYAGSARYTLLALPPVILVWLRRLEMKFGGLHSLRNIVWAGVLLTVFYSMAISYADYRFAETYRVAARSLVQQYPNRQIWFTGEWGYRYYMEKLGARPLARTDNSAAEGDLIIKPFIAMPWVTLYDGEGYSRFVEQREMKEFYPIRILDFSSHAGFYSSGWGILPISLSVESRWEWFNVYEVRRQYDGVIPKEERHW